MKDIKIKKISYNIGDRNRPHSHATELGHARIPPKRKPFFPIWG